MRESAQVTLDARINKTQTALDTHPDGLVSFCSRANHDGEKNVLPNPMDVARELHDGVIQDLCYLRFQAQALASRLNACKSSESPSAELIVDQVDQALSSVRQVIQQHRPPPLQKCDLAQSTLHFAERIEEECGLPVRVIDHLETRLSDESSFHMLRIVQEAIRNAVRHSRATSIRIRLKTQGDLLGARVVDNGQGLSCRGPLPAGNMGLRNMHHRAETLGGRLFIWSRPNLGTIIQSVVPR